MAGQSHTPWFAVCADDDPAWRVRGDEGVLVADLENSDFTHQTDSEHARLIAAAPELLEACKPSDLEDAADIVEAENAFLASELRKQARAQRAAIAKATGEGA